MASKVSNIKTEISVLDSRRQRVPMAPTEEAVLLQLKAEVERASEMFCVVLIFKLIGEGKCSNLKHHKHF
jgi:hypothetical protein